MDDRWVAHPVDSDTPIAADGVANTAVTGTHVRPLRSASIIEQNVLVAGCAPALGMLGARLGERPGAGRLRWLPRPSLASLHLLREGLVHVAGLHLLDESSGEYNVPWIRDAFADRAVRVVTLARWQQGLAVARDNPRGVRRVIHLARPGVRVVRRPSGSGAQQLLERHLRGESLTLDNLNIVAQAPDHGSVARLISMGLADSGPCIESVAMEFELDFIPLAEERFDLVVPVDYDELPSIRTLLAELDTPAFRRELDACGGYQSAQTGHVVEVVQ